jgi:hypothetical protein
LGFDRPVSGHLICTIAFASAAVNSSTLADIFIEQNFGPHTDQNWAPTQPSSALGLA